MLGWTHACMDRRIHGDAWVRVRGCMDAWGCIDADEHTDAWIDGYMAMHGSTDTWRCMDVDHFLLAGLLANHRS